MICPTDNFATSMRRPPGGSQPRPPIHRPTHPHTSCRVQMMSTPGTPRLAAGPAPSTGWLATTALATPAAAGCPASARWCRWPLRCGPGAASEGPCRRDRAAGQAGLAPGDLGQAAVCPALSASHAPSLHVLPVVHTHSTDSHEKTSPSPCGSPTPPHFPIPVLPMFGRPACRHQLAGVPRTAARLAGCSLCPSHTRLYACPLYHSPDPMPPCHLIAPTNA